MHRQREAWVNGALSSLLDSDTTLSAMGSEDEVDAIVLFVAEFFISFLTSQIFLVFLFCSGSFLLEISLLGMCIYVIHLVQTKVTFFP